jgi:hypothetical protein
MDRVDHSLVVQKNITSIDDLRGKFWDLVPQVRW